MTTTKLAEPEMSKPVPRTTNLATALLEAAHTGAGAIGTIYLIHFDRPYRHARHYTGWTLDLDTRLSKHNKGVGARLLDVINHAGITWQLARTWAGTRQQERALKRQGGASRRCPLCGINPRNIDPDTELLTNLEPAP